jgi:hypothetical protein
MRILIFDDHEVIQYFIKQQIESIVTNVEIIQGSCADSGCWHRPGSTTGTKCIHVNTDKYLQCCKHDTDDVIDAINRLAK